jgi:Asp-tRNA(Asn)/Glu-tRNA(Gln) amidotransferase A subunit family amidase
VTVTTTTTASERGAAAAVRDGRVTSEALVADCLERAAALEPTLHAWAHLDADRALEEARRRDREPPRGPLHGVPVAVKDIVDTADQPTAYGSPIHAGHRPARDATAVARLREAGAVIVGKTVTTEFALFQPGPTTNPHDVTRTPGGSSSGSAAAVAAGVVPLAVGTQTAGSVVRPASFCGVLGAKPTFGAVPTDGVKPCSTTLDTVGVLGRDVTDVALALGVMAGDVAAFTPAELGDRPRVGFCRTPQWDQLEPSTRSILERAADRLAAHVDLVEVDLPPHFAELVDAQRTIMGFEARRELARERTDHADQLSDQVRTYLDEAAALGDRYADALALAGRCRAELPDLFADTPLLFAPSVLGEAPPLATTGDPLLCRSWTLLGTPTVAVPGLTGPSGLPLGTQVIAAPGDDATALAGAARLAELFAADGPATPTPTTHPQHAPDGEENP